MKDSSRVRYDTWLSLATEELLTASSSLHATFFGFFSLRLMTRVFRLFLVASGFDLTSLGALQFLAKCPGRLQLKQILLFLLLSFIRSILVAFEERLNILATE